MAAAEDCASVLEQFVHDAANLPAEISHMMEEIQAKDTELQKHQAAINGKDGNLQKHIKINGALQAHPKESEYAEQVKKNFDLCSDLQTQKIVLSEKACNLLDRQIKRLDSKIRELQNDGQLIDGPPLPSIFNRKAEPPKSFIDIPANLPLQAVSVSALNANAHRMNSQISSLQQAQARQAAQVAALATAPQRSSAPATPAAALQHQRQREREVSLGAESRKRKLAALGTANLPTQPSNLRQSSLGPGTPKAGTPTGTSGSRAGSIPRTTVAPQSNTVIMLKKTALSKKVMANQMNKMKNKQAKRLSLAGRKKGQSPSVRSGRGGTAASEGDDSVLSSADASETDASQTRSRGGRKKKVKQEVDVEMVEEEDHEDEDGDDDTRYCICNERSYGEMVACENDDCRFQWFHVTCINMKTIPGEDEDWYCSECRAKPEIIELVRKKAAMKKAGRK